MSRVLTRQEFKVSISRKKGAYNSPLSSQRTELMLAPLLLKVYFVSTKITFRSLEIVYHMQNKTANTARLMIFKKRLRNFRSLFFDVECVHKINNRKEIYIL